MSKRATSKNNQATPESGKPYLRLLQMGQTFLIWQNERHSVKEAPPEVFDGWIRQFVDIIKNVDTFEWNMFDRWQIVNAVLDAGLLVFNKDVLERKKNLPSLEVNSEEKTSDLVPISDVQIYSETAQEASV